MAPFFYVYYYVKTLTVRPSSRKPSFACTRMIRPLSSDATMSGRWRRYSIRLDVCNPHSQISKINLESIRLTMPIYLIELMSSSNLKHPSLAYRSTSTLTHIEHTWVRVLCPLTGKFCACLFPLYAPISFNLLIFSLISRRKSFSIVMEESSELRSSTCLGDSSPNLHEG